MPFHVLIHQLGPEYCPSQLIQAVVFKLRLKLSSLLIFQVFLPVYRAIQYYSMISLYVIKHETDNKFHFYARTPSYIFS